MASLRLLMPFNFLCIYDPTSALSVSALFRKFLNNSRPFFATRRRDDGPMKFDVMELRGPILRFEFNAKFVASGPVYFL